MLSALLGLPIRLYQLLLRPVLGPNCRFVPSCSDYALEALRAHGAARGGALAACRIARCNPWCEGGHDPVPPTGAARSVSPAPGVSGSAVSTRHAVRP